MLAKLLFARGQKSSPSCSASSASSDGSYRTGDESAAYYPRSTTHSGTPGSSVSRCATQRSGSQSNNSYKGYYPHRKCFPREYVLTQI
jgi:hypothetical protein